jgi:hypothetical protein
MVVKDAMKTLEVIEDRSAETLTIMPAENS